MINAVQHSREKFIYMLAVSQHDKKGHVTKSHLTLIQMK